MKNKQQPTLLLGLTAFCVVLALVLCGFILQFTHVIRAAQGVQMQAVEIQNMQVYRQMMFGELNEYSKRNPDILRIIQPAGTPAPAPAKTPAK